MNLIFGRNVLSALFLVVFALDLIFGNGVDSWRHWIAGAAFFVSVDDLISTFEQYRREGQVSTYRWKIVQHVLSVLIIAFFVCDLVTGRNIVWHSWLIGLGFAFALRNIATTVRDRKTSIRN